MRSTSAKRLIPVIVILFIVWTQNRMLPRSASGGVQSSTFSTAFTILTVLVVLLFVRQIFRARRERQRSRESSGGLPRAGEFWMARVPYADGTGSKDRPCLVLDGSGSIRRVLYVTSQNKDDDACYVGVDSSGWSGPVAQRRSWMRVAQRDGSDPRLPVAAVDFRRLLGPVSPRDAAEVHAHGVPAAF